MGISIRDLLIKSYYWTKRDYVKKAGGRRMLIAYLSEPFFKKNDSRYMGAHQNRREALMMAEVLDEMGFSYRFSHFQKPGLNPKGYDIVFGLEPVIDRCVGVNPGALKIYYATGAYVEHQNRMVRARTDEFNRRTGASVPYYRLVPPHSSSENADAVIQIGSKFTIATYPEELRSKIITIRQACEKFRFPDFMRRKDESVSFDEYIWMGSKGSILKGLDIVLDYFMKAPGKRLHVLGPVDPEVMSYYRPLTERCDNITFHGFHSLDSDEIESLALRSGFVIMPSASEGCPGAVVNMMKLGCIPIVSPYAAFDEIEEYGKLIDGFSWEDVREAVESLDKEGASALRERMRRCHEFANANWNDENFKADFRTALTTVLKQRGAIYDCKGR